MNELIYNIAEALEFFLVALAVLATLAVRRTPRIKESPVVETGRNLVVGGWFVLAGRLGWLVFFDSAQPQSAAGMISISMLALGSVVVSVGRLMAADIKQPCEDCPYKALAFQQTLDDPRYRAQKAP